MKSSVAEFLSNCCAISTQNQFNSERTLLDMVPEQTFTLTSLEDLESFIHKCLCEKENLLGDQFALQKSELHSRGRACGIQYSLHGPRSIRLGAIWAADQNCLFFYDTRGERFLKIKLTTRIPLKNRIAS